MPSYIFLLKMRISKVETVTTFIVYAVTPPHIWSFSGFLHVSAMPQFPSLLLSGHTTDSVCIQHITKVCTCYTWVCTKCAVCWILLKERLRQRSIRLQSLLVQSRQCGTPVPSLLQPLLFSTRIWWRRCRPDLMESGSWINCQANTRTSQPTAQVCTHEHS